MLIFQSDSYDVCACGLFDLSEDVKRLTRVFVGFLYFCNFIRDFTLLLNEI